MIAAGKQNRAFNFAQLLYFNQGPENGGWLDDTMVAYAATSIPGVNVAALQAAAQSSRRRAEQAKTYDTQATRDGLAGTPTVLVGKTRRQADRGRAGAADRRADEGRDRRGAAAQ